MNIVEKPKYKMAIYDSQKEVHVQVIGFITEEIVEEYLTDLQMVISKVKKHDYTFVVDATYQSPLPSKVATELGQTMMIYTTFGFPRIKIILPISKIAFVQIRNALETVDFPGELYYQDGSRWSKEDMYRD